MITGELKSKIDRIWDAMWAGSIAIQAERPVPHAASYHPVDGGKPIR
jgi:hypothetical protein